MGMLIEGKWLEDDAARRTGADGSFVRPASVFRGRVVTQTHDESGAEFPAAAGRYHLFIAPSCPWAHRTLIFRALKKLESLISVSIVEPYMDDHGWAFSAALPDHIGGHQRLYEVYRAAVPDYTGRASVPVLWDKQRRTIVSNESS